ncbi:MAG: tRNA pseudouridine(55) synthase TruB [Clostridia bacterium]|nr:tRNA pseudouridine(55) synthase TruB [Clostridia bacterium]
MNGIILINKPKGCTSHDVVYKVKKIFNEKVGHTGTLDPMATGVLPLLVGKGTQCSKYLINHDKKYKVLLELGKKTTTADSEGDVIEEKEVIFNLDDTNAINAVLKLCIGRQMQTPPIYSAIKVNGKKLYEYARSGQEVEIKPREITIYDLKLLNVIPEKKQIDFEVTCSKGTYIRSLCETIAERLYTIGYMKELQRIQVGDFKLEDTITIEELQKYYEENELRKLEGKSFISIEKIFNNKWQMSLNDRDLRLFLNGVKLTQKYPDGIYRIYNKENFIGIGVIKNNLLKRDIIIE